MDERQLRYAAAIRAAGSLTGAAGALGREPSTLARALKRLEGELGAAFFRRGALGLTATREGEVFFEYADEAFRLLAAMNRAEEGNLTEREMEYLKIRLAYPEKFWKTANAYYRSNKAWISAKSIEKLTTAIAQTREKERFLNQIFSFHL